MDKQELINLYETGKSMADIARALHCSIHKIVYWMDKYKITRRSHSEAAYIQANPGGDPFEIKKILTPDEQLLFGIGIGIYLGEGTKVAKHALRIANTDPFILKLFLKFLFDICRFKKERISYSIICFHDTNPETARSFWSNQLKISGNKFGKITQIPTQGKGTYKKKSRFGVCIVQANNVKLAQWLRSYIEEINSRDGSVVEQVIGNN